MYKFYSAYIRIFFIISLEQTNKLPAEKQAVGGKQAAEDSRTQTARVREKAQGVLIQPLLAAIQLAQPLAHCPETEGLNIPGVRRRLNLSEK